MAKILWHSCAPWAPSGYGTQTAQWVAWLAGQGHEMIISSYWGIAGSITQWNGIPVLPGFGGNYCSPSLFEHTKHVNPDLVITLGDVWVLDAGMVAQLPIAHWLPSDCRPMSQADLRVVEAAAPELIAMSKFGYDNFVGAGKNPVYVPHGIDTDIFTPITNRKKLRTKAGIEPDEFVIGINGANNDAIRKALPEQMVAFAIFHQKHPDAVLALHTGVRQDGGQDLEAVAESLGILDRVRVVDQYRYTSGQITPKDLAEWYGVIDVLCAASYGEGFGLPIMEAQACGTPVITTAASSMEELNPFGYTVDGEPFWNGVHKAWWIRPSIKGLADAYEQAYNRRKNVPRKKLREFAQTYDTRVVGPKFMAPAVEELVERMNRKRKPT